MINKINLTAYMLKTLRTLSTSTILILLGSQMAMSICFDDLGIPRSTPTQDFEFSANAPFAIHKKTGLMWLRCPVGYVFSSTEGCLVSSAESQSYTWENALNVSARRAFHGFGGWRLPNIKELQSISEYGCLPLLNPDVFPGFLPVNNGTARVFWSSTPVESSNAVPRAIQMDLNFGDTNTSSVNSQNLVFLVRDTRVDFSNTIAPTFEHPRCQNCHAVAATNFVSGGDANGVGLPSGHPLVSASTPNATCEGCHTSDLQPPGDIDPGWHEAPLSNDLRNLSLSDLCERATDVPLSAISAHQHLTEDRLVLWAFAPNRPFGGEFEPAPPYNIEAWKDAIDVWRDIGLPCPTQ